MGIDQAIQHLTEKAIELSTEGRIFFALAIQILVLLDLIWKLKKLKIVDEINEDRMFWGIFLLAWSISFFVFEGIIIGSIQLGVILTIVALFISAIFYIVIPKIYASDISFESIEKEHFIIDTVLNFCKTGIQWNFDSILGGGIPRGQVVLVSGDYGAGKTIFGLEFLYNGANFFEENGAFLSLNETLSDLTENTKAIGWDLHNYEKSIHIERLLPSKAGFFRNIITGKIRPKNLEIPPEKILRKVLSLARNDKTLKRIVIDPFPCIGATKEKNEEIEILRFYQMLNLIVKKHGLTCLIISHSHEKSTYWEIEPFLASTVFVLTKKQLANGRVLRTIRIEKNRGTRAYPNEYVFEIRGEKDKPYKLKGIIYRNKDKEEFEEVPGIWVSATSFGTFGTSEVNNIGT